jgi:ABC-type polysaccharide/polyol phosphate transport system ATPase subunit
LGPAVVVRGLWEHFRVLEDRSKTFKELVSRLRLAGSRSDFWALRDVSFEVGQGETIGLIGENGSGKSTLLRCLAGILPPSRGEVLVSGAVATLIEVGAGFHPELTGRENLMVTGALAGLKRSRLRDRLDSIVSFAELERVIDQPVRSYSSGMYVRLAFSLAIHVEPEILLIDEALSVGDEAFQRKCVRRVAELGQAGVTIVFVSHDMPLLAQVCRRCLLLHAGEVLKDGETTEVVDHYLTIERLKESGAPST